MMLWQNWRSMMRLFLVLALFIGLAGPAVAQNVYSSVTIDSSELASKATRRFADVAARGVREGLREPLAGRVGKRGAPRVVVRLKSVMLTNDMGGRRDDDDDFDGRSPFRRFGVFRSEPMGSDNLIGEALVMSPKGRVLARIPMFNALKPQRSIMEKADQWPRIVRLGRDYGYWLGRKL
jgi:hypothetical protein